MTTVFLSLCLISLISAILNGRIAELSAAVLDGAERAVSLTLSLVGMMGLWCGIMAVFRQTGVLRLIARLLSPLLRLIFPGASKHPEAIGAVAASITANIFGLGNAATPLGIKAMEELAVIGGREYASDDTVTFAVVNTASFCLLPTTLIALRNAAGSVDPFEVVVPVWICSALCMTVAVIFSKLLAPLFRKGSLP